MEALIWSVYEKLIKNGPSKVLKIVEDYLEVIGSVIFFLVHS